MLPSGVVAIASRRAAPGGVLRQCRHDRDRFEPTGGPAAGGHRRSQLVQHPADRLRRVGRGVAWSGAWARRITECSASVPGSASNAKTATPSWPLSGTSTERPDGSNRIWCGCDPELLDGMRSGAAWHGGKDAERGKRAITLIGRTATERSHSWRRSGAGRTGRPPGGRHLLAAGRRLSERTQQAGCRVAGERTGIVGIAMHGVEAYADRAREPGRRGSRGRAGAGCGSRRRSPGRWRGHRCRCRVRRAPRW